MTERKTAPGTSDDATARAGATPSRSLADHWPEAFARLDGQRAAGGSGGWLGPRRTAALARFAETGFPTTRDEEWRTTSTAGIAGVPWQPAAAAPAAAAVDEAWLGRYRLVGAVAEIVLVDGHFVPALSHLGGLPASGDDLRAGGLAAILAGAGRIENAWLEPWLGQLAQVEANPFVALNLAFFQDGGFLRVPSGRTLAGQVHVLHVATGTAAHASRSMPTPRTLVVLEAGAGARLVESFVAGSGAAGTEALFTNAVTEIALGEGASLEHDRLVLEGQGTFHVATIEVRQERSSRYSARGFCLGGKLVRNDWNVVQAGEGTDTTLDGLYVARGEEHVDNHTSIDHAHPHGTSRELYKGILDDRAHGVFNGKVTVRPGAQKTDSRQTNRNLLLSRDALIDTKPQLEIFADDVKCAHGATIGQMDETALFYLRSRGLGEAESRSLITFAFGSEVVSRVRDEGLRARVRDLLLERLPGGERLKEIP